MKISNFESNDIVIIKQSKEKMIDEKNAVLRFLDMSKQIHELMYSLTGINYHKNNNKNHINYSTQHHIVIIKTLDSKTVVALIEQLRMLQYAIDSMESLMSSGEEVEQSSLGQ